MGETWVGSESDRLPGPMILACPVFRRNGETSTIVEQQELVSARDPPGMPVERTERSDARGGFCWPAGKSLDVDVCCV